jgi:hypothetical protein
VRAHVAEDAPVGGPDFLVAELPEPLVQLVRHLALDVLEEADQWVLRALCHFSQVS